MRIYATRIEAPTPGHDNATRWVVVSDDGPGVNRSYHDAVEINGASVVRIAARPDDDPPPHVYVEPSPDAQVLGIVLVEGEETFTVLQQPNVPNVPPVSDADLTLPAVADVQPPAATEVQREPVPDL